MYLSVCVFGANAFHRGSFQLRRLSVSITRVYHTYLSHVSITITRIYHTCLSLSHVSITRVYHTCLSHVSITRVYPVSIARDQCLSHGSRIHKYIRAYIHTYINTRTRIHTYMHACMHACMHTRIYIHKYIHTLQKHWPLTLKRTIKRPRAKSAVRPQSRVFARKTCGH
jgi:hypothetical protein